MSKKDGKVSKKVERSRRRADRVSRPGPKSAPARKSPATGLLLDFTGPHSDEESRVEAWWVAFSSSDGETRLRMTREALEKVGPDHACYKDLFPEAVLELEGELPQVRYVAFLEDVLDNRPDVFDLSAHWHALAVAAACISHNRPEQLGRILRHVAGVTTTVDDPHFALISMLRLGGQEQSAQVMIDALVPLLDSSDLMPWGVDQLIAWAMFEANQRCAAAGASDEAIEESYQFLLQLGAEDSGVSRRHQRTIALHWAGKVERQWSREDFFVRDKDRVAGNLYFLLVDFMRWLCERRGLSPVASDEFRHILIQCIEFMKCPASALLTGLKRSKFEPFLAGKLDFLCLDNGHAPAAVAGMLHLYDFLLERGLVDGPTRDSATRTLAILWKELKEAMGREWERHAFLQRWLPPGFPGAAASVSRPRRLEPGY